MIKNQDPRIERWMHTIADGMQKLIEQQGQENRKHREERRRKQQTAQAQDRSKNRKTKKCEHRMKCQPTNRQRMTAGPVKKQQGM